MVLPGNDARERAEAALREAELFRLKREAIGRVPMWLDPEPVIQAPPPTRAIRLPYNDVYSHSQWDVQPMGSEPTMVSFSCNRYVSLLTPH